MAPAGQVQATAPPLRQGLPIGAADTPFRTADYGLAGYLLARGIDIDRIDRNSQQVVFCFRQCPELLVALGDYTSNKPIPCRDYFHGLRRVKCIIQEKIRDYAFTTS